MSTAAAWGTVPVEAPLGRPGRRPELILIEGGAGRDVPAARAAVLHVPRWVRLAMTLSVVAVAAVLLLGVGGAAADPGPLGSVVVKPGQTLSEIARAEMPGVLNAEAVARIQLANNLSSSQITAGQIIVIPQY